MTITILLSQYGSVCCRSAKHLALGYIWTSVKDIHEGEGMEVTKMKSVVGFCIVMELLLMSKVTVGHENKIKVVDCAQKQKNGEKGIPFSLFPL